MKESKKAGQHLERKSRDESCCNIEWIRRVFMMTIVIRSARCNQQKINKWQTEKHTFRHLFTWNYSRQVDETNKNESFLELKKKNTHPAESAKEIFYEFRECRRSTNLSSSHSWFGRNFPTSENVSLLILLSSIDAGWEFEIYLKSASRERAWTSRGERSKITFNVFVSSSSPFN